MIYQPLPSLTIAKQTQGNECTGRMDMSLSEGRFQPNFIHRVRTLLSQQDRDG